VSAENKNIVKAGGLLVRKMRWGLSWKGRLILFLVVLLGVVGAVRLIHPFLSISKPVQGEYLIVEGWVPGHAIKSAKEIFELGNYRKLITCGEPVPDDFGDRASQTYADWGASKLRKFGMSPEKIVAVDSERVKKDRTYSAALAVKAWFETNGIPVKSVDVVTSDCHARRSRMLFQKAFGPGVAVGINSVPPVNYDPQGWWRSSAGFREVMDETAAYIYAVVFVRFS
jgi:hypothetical protein